MARKDIIPLSVIKMLSSDDMEMIQLGVTILHCEYGLAIDEIASFISKERISLYRPHNEDVILVIDNMGYGNMIIDMMSNRQRVDAPLIRMTCR